MRRFEWLVATNARAAFLVSIVSLIGQSGCSRESGSAAGLEPTRTSVTKVEPKDALAQLVDLDDKQIDLRQVSNGRVRVAIFIRSDCPISNRMAPDVRELCASFQSQGVDFYLIYVDPRQKPDAIRAHVREYEYPCVALRDSDHALAAQTKATVTPEAVVFDSNWSVTYRGRINDQFEDFGKMREAPTKHDLREAIAATLAGRPVADSVTKAIGCPIADLK